MQRTTIYSPLSRTMLVGASVSPYLPANWLPDRAGGGITFEDEVLKVGIPRNHYELSAGARMEFRSGCSAWDGFGVMRGDSGYRGSNGQPVGGVQLLPRRHARRRSTVHDAPSVEPSPCSAALRSGHEERRA
ncbi:hypothetical protein ACTJJM_09305 [Stenotrophomonas sp. 22692]|uniref:hypothetical protein n=1 Tax=Stenotrophomonas sp. 22692 TaxID=3453956 RepID=UPI003F8684F0